MEWNAQIPHPRNGENLPNALEILLPASKALSFSSALSLDPPVAGGIGDTSDTTSFVLKKGLDFFAKLVVSSFMILGSSSSSVFSSQFRKVGESTV